MFEEVKLVAFEISNLCNLAWLHTKCPLHRTAESPFTSRYPTMLPTPLILRCLAELKEVSWQGEINFHQYNEPLIDPRLMALIGSTRYHLPDSLIRIVTNGYYLTVGLAKELANVGVNIFEVTPYAGASAAAMVKALRDAGLVCNLLNYPLPGLLDDRLSIYEREPKPRLAPCYAPLVHLTVACTGDVVLCCQDWARRNTFGNLKEKKLVDIIQSEKVQETYRRLNQGDRFLDVCQRCDSGRGI